MEDKEDDRMPGTVVDSRVQAPWEGEPVLSNSRLYGPDSSLSAFQEQPASSFKWSLPN